MSLPKNIYAFTESGHPPAFISVNDHIETDNPGNELHYPVIIVRSSGVGAGTGSIELTSEQALELAHKIIKRYG